MYIYTLNDEYRRLFGRKVYKLSLGLGASCPNRDGTLGTGGCAFCTGADEFSESCGSLEERIGRAVRRVESKMPEGESSDGSPRFVAYFQDHTNTYAPHSVLRNAFEEAADHPLICGISVGTRPDCLPEETVGLLAGISKRKPVWVELGLQTVHGGTAASFGRGYPLAVYDFACERLRSEGIRVVTHLILGLPGETEEMMFESVRHLSGRTDGVKFHLLHVMKGTRYAEEYAKGLIPTMSFPEYRDVLTECLRLLDPAVAVHRMTGDGDKRTLIAPLWSADKKHVLNALNAHFRAVGLKQGEHLTS